MYNLSNGKDSHKWQMMTCPNMNLAVEHDIQLKTLIFALTFQTNYIRKFRQ